MSGGGEKTEKATPKKTEDARKKGQVARSMDLIGSGVLFAALMALSAFGPMMVDTLQDATRGTLALVATPEVVSEAQIGEVMTEVSKATLIAVAPVLVACAIAGVLVNLVQVGFVPSPSAIMPKFSKLDPIKGAKNLFGVQLLFETVKNSLKIAAVGAIAAMALFPRLDELAALVGMPAEVLLPELARTGLSIAQRAAAAYFVIAIVDYLYQRWRHEKSLRMEKKEVIDEGKQQQLPAEVKSQQRQRAMTLANARMMDAVPTADVIVTNPTHYAVALRYDPDKPAPVVVAKGTDHLAKRIREAGREAGVAVVPDPPLARSLYATVDVGRMIPEEMFQAVAQLLAYVYRVAGQRAAA